MDENNNTTREEDKNSNLSLSRKCIICGKELIGNQKKYCSPHCADRSNYNKNRKRYLAYSKQWQKDNKEKTEKYRKISMIRYKENGKMNELMRKQYRNNKDKWDSRSRANKYIRTGVIDIDRKCKNCGLPGDKLRFDEYPKTKEDILKAIMDGKIYYLCSKCHKESVNNMRKNIT
jgi:hypothetical protein